MSNLDCTSDPILEELHAIRRQLHDECGGDLTRLAREMRQRQESSGHTVASVPVTGTHASEKHLCGTQKTVPDDD